MGWAAVEFFLLLDVPISWGQPMIFNSLSIVFAVEVFISFLGMDIVFGLDQYLFHKHFDHEVFEHIG